jgi:hypothetical protein
MDYVGNMWRNWTLKQVLHIVNTSLETIKLL